MLLFWNCSAILQCGGCEKCPFSGLQSEVKWALTGCKLFISFFIISRKAGSVSLKKMFLCIIFKGAWGGRLSCKRQLCGCALVSRGASSSLFLAWPMAAGQAMVGLEIRRFNKKGFMARWLGPCCSTN